MRIDGTVSAVRVQTECKMADKDTEKTNVARTRLVMPMLKRQVPAGVTRKAILESSKLSLFRAAWPLSNATFMDIARPSCNMASHNPPNRFTAKRHQLLCRPYVEDKQSGKGDVSIQIQFMRKQRPTFDLHS